MTHWLTVQAAAEYLSVSPNIIRAAVKAGDLPAYPVGTGRQGYRLTAHQLDEWMMSRSYEPRGRAS